LSRQLEEVTRERHIGDVTALKQAQQINILLEENAMLRRHLGFQQTNLNHYRLSAAMSAFEPAPSLAFINGF